jgi:hypothetical protein
VTAIVTRELLSPAGRAAGRSTGGGPHVGSIGYTGSYREPSRDIAEVSVVSVLEARGPE